METSKPNLRTSATLAAMVTLLQTQASGFENYSLYASASSFVTEISVSAADSTKPIDDESTLQTKFNELVAKWRKETALHSVIHRIVLHPSYQQIIGMGNDALPLIFQELKRSPHWIWALKAITGQNPVSSPDDLRQAVADWQKWGHEHGFA